MTVIVCFTGKVFSLYRLSDVEQRWWQVKRGVSELHQCHGMSGKYFSIIAYIGNHEWQLIFGSWNMLLRSTADWQHRRNDYESTNYFAICIVSCKMLRPAARSMSDAKLTRIVYMRYFSSFYAWVNWAALFLTDWCSIPTYIGPSWKCARSPLILL